MTQVFEIIRFAWLKKCEPTIFFLGSSDLSQAEPSQKKRRKYWKSLVLIGSQHLSQD